MLRAGIILINGVQTGYRAVSETVPALVGGQSYPLAYLNANFVQVDAAALLAQKVDCPVSTGGAGMGLQTVVDKDALSVLTVQVPTQVTVTADIDFGPNMVYYKFSDGTIRPAAGSPL